MQAKDTEASPTPDITGVTPIQALQPCSHHISGHPVERIRPASSDIRFCSRVYDAGKGTPMPLCIWWYFSPMWNGSLSESCAWHHPQPSIMHIRFTRKSG